MCKRLFVFIFLALLSHTVSLGTRLIDLATNGADVTIYGADSGDKLATGSMVVGDFDGDGFNDIAISAPKGDGPDDLRNEAGEVYIIFGPLPPGEIDLSLPPSNVVVIYGADSGDGGTPHGYPLGSGDVNEDGFDDILIGAPGGDGPGNSRSDCGEAYVIFGRSRGEWPSSIDLANGGQSIIIWGAEAGDMMGSHGIACGDVNGDDIADILIRSPRACGPDNTRWRAGEVYILYGSASPPAEIDLANKAQDVIIYGADTYDSLGSRLSVGDVNGDGLNDLIVGAVNADGPGNARGNASGEIYVFYGPVTSPILDIKEGDQDVTIFGAEPDDILTVRNVNDIDGDNVFDILACAGRADGPANTRPTAGEAYIIFGGPVLPNTIDILANEQDVTIWGADVGLPSDGGLQRIGSGDLNNDGIDDLILGSVYTDPSCRTDAGEVYVIYGRSKEQWPVTIDLEDDPQAITVWGADPHDGLGSALNSCDLSGDGIDDLVIGAGKADGFGDTRPESGEVYIIFTNSPPIANFSFTPAEPTTQDIVQFIDLSKDPDGNIVLWSWDFGDGGSSSLQHPAHTYAQGGVYTVTLTVEDDDGAMDTATKEIEVANCFNYITIAPHPLTGEGSVFWLCLPKDAIGATLKIFDLDGAELVSIPLDPTADRYPETGRWIPQDDKGRLLGTGLYLYLVEIVHADGTVTYSPVQKMVIQR